MLILLESYYDSIATATACKSNEMGTYILVVSLMARVYKLQHKNELALHYFQKSLNLIHKLNDKPDHQFYLLSEIAELYEQNDEHQRAYRQNFLI